jgi:hydroxypyruvate reductase
MAAPADKPTPDRGARPVLFLGAAIPADFVAQLARHFDVQGPSPLPLVDAVTSLPPNVVERVRALLMLGVMPCPPAAMDGLPNLGIICCLGSGFDGVDVADARDRGIVVTNSPSANASTVADFAMALLLASVRGIFPASDKLRRGQWKGNAVDRMPLQRGLTGRRVGLYGMGAIGEKIAARAAAFEMEVGYHNRHVRTDVPHAYFPSLLALATWADVLVVAVRAGPATRHAVDADVLAALGPDGHVVNIARGSVIDETALIAALQSRGIAGAALDVFEHEPSVPAALLALPNVVATPHMAGGTVQAQQAMQAMVLANLDAFHAGRPVPHPVG